MDMKQFEQQLRTITDDELKDVRRLVRQEDDRRILLVKGEPKHKRRVKNDNAYHELAINGAEDQNMMHPLTAAVLNSIHLGAGILKQSVWPVDAEYGVEYKAHDRQFPQVKHSKVLKFFRTEAELDQWLSDQADWVRSTDYDFEISYSLYKWDLGPEFVKTETI